ncbi:hypothetical protein ACPB67_24925 [Micromonospora taraxaci]|uniref:hypothetical protein n=1 Tax=Micromonospora taraxaci TaxID=1316803 RepID=UPI003C2AD89F
MGYDISFFMPGHDDEGLSDELLLHLTNEQEAAWRRIVARAEQEIGPADEGRYPTHLELWLHEPAMQLCYAGNSASIEIPYRYTGPPEVVLELTSPQSVDRASRSAPERPRRGVRGSA